MREQRARTACANSKFIEIHACSVAMLKDDMTDYVNISRTLSSARFTRIVNSMKLKVSAIGAVLSFMNSVEFAGGVKLICLLRPQQEAVACKTS